MIINDYSGFTGYYIADSLSNRRANVPFEPREVCSIDSAPACPANVLGNMSLNTNEVNTIL